MESLHQRWLSRASSDTARILGEPLVSIICFCKDRAATIRRCVESVLNQTYKNIEFVVQDGASTDGTLEILRSYGDPRIKLVSQKDSGPAEAFWKVLNRCQGDIIGTCLSDEELLPDAVERAVSHFRSTPHVGAITCDGFVTDPTGKVIDEFNAGEFSFVDYLFDRYCPFWPGSFFRRQALIEVGLKDHRWTIECLEFETWCRLATQHEVRYIPERMSKYAVHDAQLSQTGQYFHEHFDNRAALIRRMFSGDGFFGQNSILLLGCLYNQLYLLYNHVRAYRLVDQMNLLGRRLRQLVEEIGLADRIQFLDYFAFAPKKKIISELALHLWLRAALATPASVRRRIPRRAKRMGLNALIIAVNFALNTRDSIALILDTLKFWVKAIGKRRAIATAQPPLKIEVASRRKINVNQIVTNLSARAEATIPPSARRRIPGPLKRMAVGALKIATYVVVTATDAIVLVLDAIKHRIGGAASRADIITPHPSLKIQHEVAQLYYARGQIDQALQLWRKAEALGSPTVDALACQAMLMSPSATYPRLLAMQQRWAERHAKPLPKLANHTWPAYDGKRRIRVGYFCSFLDSDTIRFQMNQVIRHHNRDNFEVYGYSPSRASPDIVEVFDKFRVTGVMSDDAFIRTIRSDEIDVFVELSGFSPQNRFTAMASRCAPVQISYLNHTGTSGTPNVDYVLADNVCVLSEEDRFFTEKVWRLPGSFFCFNFDGASLPDVASPPSRANGFVTFCCFGSGGKINGQMIALWAEIIKRVPNSIFFIRNAQLSKPDNRRYLQDRFRRFGVPAERLRILGGTDRETILKCYAEADISLDTWPYCGGNTIAEAVWQGVPVVTYKGNRFSSRYGSSLVMASGCPELVAETPQQYVDIAVQLAHNPERLDHYRRNLRKMAREHGLSDAKKFAANLESAYLDMLTRAMAAE